MSLDNSTLEGRPASYNLNSNINKFAFQSGCTFCNRKYNIYRLSKDDPSELVPRTTLVLPLLLACGHSACEKCVYEAEKFRCEACIDKHIPNEEFHDFPHDLGTIERNKEILFKKLKTFKNILIYEGSTVLIETMASQMERVISAGSFGMSYKIKENKKDLTNYKDIVKKIYEFTATRAGHNDVATVSKRLNLASEIFKADKKYDSKLKSDLKRLPIGKNPKIPNYASVLQIDTIIDLVNNGKKVVIGHQISNELCWTPVEVVNNSLYFNHFGKNFVPGDHDTLIQYNWLQISEKNLPSGVFIDIAISDLSVERLELPDFLPKTFRVVIQIKEISIANLLTETVPNYNPTLAMYFCQMCSGENGVTFIDSKTYFLDDGVAVFSATPEDLCPTLPTLQRLEPVIDAGLIYLPKAAKERFSKFHINARSLGPGEQVFDECVFARIESGLHYLLKLCDVVKMRRIVREMKLGKSRSKIFTLYSRSEIMLDLYYPTSNSKVHPEELIAKITDCGLFFKGSKIEDQLSDGVLYLWEAEDDVPKVEDDVPEAEDDLPEAAGGLPEAAGGCIDASDEWGDDSDDWGDASIDWADASADWAASTYN